MAISSISAIINDDIHKVWDIVFAVDKYSMILSILVYTFSQECSTLCCLL